jgi:hypothetical protein
VNHGSIVPSAEGSPDFTRANASILSIRDEIRRTRDRVPQSESRQLPLTNMTRACNRYLELSAVSPSHYAILLGELREELFANVRQLVAIRSGLVVQEPGAGAY